MHVVDSPTIVLQTAGAHRPIVLALSSVQCLFRGALLLGRDQATCHEVLFAELVHECVALLRRLVLLDKEGHLRLVPYLLWLNLAILVMVIMRSASRINETSEVTMTL